MRFPTDVLRWDIRGTYESLKALTCKDFKELKDVDKTVLGIWFQRIVI